MVDVALAHSIGNTGAADDGLQRPAGIEQVIAGAEQIHIEQHRLDLLELARVLHAEVPAGQTLRPLARLNVEDELVDAAKGEREPEPRAARFLFRRQLVVAEAFGGFVNYISFAIGEFVQGISDWFTAPAFFTRLYGVPVLGFALFWLALVFALAKRGNVQRVVQGEDVGTLVTETGE